VRVTAVSARSPVCDGAANWRKRGRRAKVCPFCLAGQSPYAEPPNHVMPKPSCDTPTTHPSRLRRLLQIAALGGYLLFAVGINALLLLDLRQHGLTTRGIESGAAPTWPSPVEPRFGVNVNLDRVRSEDELARILRTLRLAGIRVIRQRVRWAELEPRPGEYRWARWDEQLAAFRANGLQVVVVLEGAPLWARHEWEADNPHAPPADTANLARFADVFARRYFGQILAYQIWDEPNIYPHWGNREIDPAGYVEMLREVSAAIRRADEKALIIAGGLAPNTEPGGRNMSDVLYLREIYRRGASEFFDILGAKTYGFWSGPYDRRVDEEVLNFSRVILLREEMIARGDAGKPVWAVEGGWAALPADWRGTRPAQGSDVPVVQSQRLAWALKRIREEWPWLGLACVQTVVTDLPADDPQWAFSLLDADGQTTMLYRALRDALTDERVIYPGLTRHLDEYLQPWRASSAASLQIWGTDVYLEVERGIAEGTINVRVHDGSRETVVDLSATRPTVERVRVASGMALQTHRLVVEGSDEQLERVRGVLVARRDRPWGLWARLLVGATLIAYGGVASWRVARGVAWRRVWVGLQDGWKTVPAPVRWAALGTSFVGWAALPWPQARLLALLVYGVLALLGPWKGLLVAVACVPLAPLVTSLGPGTFSLSEVAVLVAACGWVWNLLLATPGGRHGRRSVPRMVHTDWLVLSLVLLGVIAALAAEYKRVAYRELRVVILESALLYALVRGQSSRRDLCRLVDVLWVSAIGVALYALLRYPTAKGVILAEGVRRARAFYGSPNNLALYLERVLPLGLAVALVGCTSWRRWLYVLGAIPVGVSLVLTFSRGALLVGLPASLVLLALLMGGRWRWLLVGVLAAGLLTVVPLMGPERLASLADPTQGTVGLRLELWQSAWEMVRDHPWLGVGPDNFLYYYGDYIRAGAMVDRWLSHPHNLVLDFWLRLGLGGPLVLASLLAVLGWQAVGVLMRPVGGDERAMTIGLLAGVAAAVTHGLIDAFFFVPELAFWLLLVLAWVVQESRLGVHPTRCEEIHKPD